MVNCGACGRFMTKTDGALCSNCPLAFHNACLGKARAAAKLPNWLCPECSKSKPRDNRSDTPAKGVPEADLGDCDINCDVLSIATPKIIVPTVTAGSSDLVIEMRLLREQLSGVQDKIDLLRQDFQDLRCTLTSNTSRITALEEKVEFLEKDFTAKQDTARGLVEEIIKLKHELNERDQELLANDIEITNLPENNGENPSHLVLLIGNKLGVNLEERDIVSAERVGPRQPRGGSSDASMIRVRSRPIVVRLTRRTLRDELLRSMRVRRGANTADFGLASESRPFYINERLTRFNRMLLFKAREARARLQWRFVWTKRGRIFAKQAEGKPIFTIRSEDDLCRVFGNASV